MALPSPPQTGPLSDRVEKAQSSHPLRGIKPPLQPEELVGALQVAHDNVVDIIYELEEATPAFQTLGNIIVKDVLILASIAFWPTMIYWLM